MTFNKSLILAGLVSVVTTLNALQPQVLSDLNKIMDDGVVVNKKIETSNPNIELFIYKGLVTENSAYALLKLSNFTKDSVKVRDIVKDGEAIKSELMVGEATYIVVEEKKISNTVTNKIANSNKNADLGLLIKESNFPVLKDRLSNVFGVYFVNNKNVIQLISKQNLMEYFSSVKVLDYYTYLETDIQKGLYKGFFINGYETLIDGKITPKTYYFVMDNLTKELVYIYVMNQKLSFEDLKSKIEVVKNDK
jgi:hypothetical protein